MLPFLTIVSVRTLLHHQGVLANRRMMGVLLLLFCIPGALSLIIFQTASVFTSGSAYLEPIPDHITSLNMFQAVRFRLRFIFIADFSLHQLH